MISVVIATYGSDQWSALADERAYPSTRSDGDYLNIVRHHEPDGTRASSLNNGAENALGTWLLFLDADDELAPGYLGAMRRALEREHEDAHALLTPAVQKILKGRPGKPSFFDRGISLRDDNWLVIGTLIHKDLFHRVGGFPDYPHGFEDFALWSKCYRIGARVVKVPDAVYRYHWNPQSAHKRGWRNRRWQVETHQRVVRELDEWEKAHA